MNKIFKVIWSKSKQCYVVVSEMAKNTTGKKKIVVASILATLAMTPAVQDVNAVDGSGNRAGFSDGSSGVAFHSTQGLAIGLKNGDVTSANGNVATVAVGAHSNSKGSSSVAIGGGSANGQGAVALGWVSATGNQYLKNTDIRVTRIAQGISFGSDIEYVDEVTLSRAISGRIEL